MEYCSRCAKKRTKKRHDEWIMEHKDKCREYSNKYYITHKNEKLRYQRKYRHSKGINKKYSKKTNYDKEE